MKHTGFFRLSLFASLFFAAFSAFAQRSSGFDSISMVALGPSGVEAHDTFLIGEGSQSYPAKRWIAPFEMNRYETTYELWHTIRTISETMGYVYLHKGQEGSGGKLGKEPTAKGGAEPVTMISWYDAIVWCNALSEIHGLTPCYSFEGAVLRDASETMKCDMAECDWNADGYRLPSESEWEYAARRTPTGFQSGDAVSGHVHDVFSLFDAEGESDYAWTSLNAARTHVVGTAGSPFPESLSVRAGTGKANAMGLFDMSGNVGEFCWDWEGRYGETEPGERATGPAFGSERVSRGGSWSVYTPFCSAGDRYSFDPNAVRDYLGFRIARTASKR